MCSPTEVSALVPTNVCRHSKLLNKHAVRDDQQLRTIVDVGKALGHGDMRSMNGTSSEKDHAIASNMCHGCTVLCTIPLTRWSQKSDGHVPACTA